MSDHTSVAYEAVQTAVYAAISGHITGAVYDAVPGSAVFPYTVLGDVGDTEFEARGVKGRAVVFSTRTYTRDVGGKFPCYRIMAQIVEHLTASRLVMNGWQEVQKTYRASGVTLDTVEAGTFVGTVSFVMLVVRS